MLKRILFLSIFASAMVLGATKIMPLGDSITYDEYHVDDRPVSKKSGYRNYLWYKLRDIDYSADFVGSRWTGGDITPSFDGDNEGHPGWTSYDIAEHVYHFLEMNTPDIILLHIGTNDWSRSSSGVESILDEIDHFESNNGVSIKVILALIINRSSHSSLISDFNANVYTMARRRIDNGDNIKLVDMEDGADIKYNRDIKDGTHPNDCGYEKMANLWFEAITGEGSPRLKYSNCQEIIDELKKFPETLVAKENIVSVEVDDKTKTVVSTIIVPDSGIIF